MADAWPGSFFHKNVHDPMIAQALFETGSGSACFLLQPETFAGGVLAGRLKPINLCPSQW